TRIRLMMIPIAGVLPTPRPREPRPRRVPTDGEPARSAARGRAARAGRPLPPARDRAPVQLEPYEHSASDRARQAPHRAARTRQLSTPEQPRPAIEFVGTCPHNAYHMPARQLAGFHGHTRGCQVVERLTIYASTPATGRAMLAALSSFRAEIWRTGTGA